MDETRPQDVVFGRHVVAEQLKSGAGVDTLLLSDSLDGKTIGYFTALAKPAGAVLKRVPAARLNALCGSEKHQGVAAYAAQITYCGLEDLLNIARRRGEPPFLLLCDGVEDPHNLGALLRSALLCGAHGAVIPRRGSAAVTPVVMKASAGAAGRLPVARVTNLGEAVRRLKKQNLFVWCADMGGSPLARRDLSGPLALVMGGEGKGVGALVKKLCDGAVSLPMAAGGGVDSFNVSVAGGIIMYEVFRRRQGGG
jgi:23S rRNA (guanosine2251-2'-O)-methyltransferase